MSSLFGQLTQRIRRQPLLAAGLALVFAFGLGLRIWMTTQPLGALDSDMAILGLMAQEVQRGHFSIFHWGQYYGGAQETYLAALLGIFTGVNKFVLQLTTIILAFGACVSLWFATKEVVNQRAAWFASVLFWVWPGPFVWWSVKIGSNYWFASMVALISVYLLARLRHRDVTSNQFILLGIALGMTVWANPQAAYIIIPAVIAYSSVIWKNRTLVHWIFAGGVLGGAPWVISNIGTRFQSLKPAGGTTGDVGRGVNNFFTDLAPQVFGFKVPFDGRFLLGGFGVALCVAIGLLIVIGPLRLKAKPWLPWGALIGGSALFVLTQWALYQSQPRYTFWLAPWLLMIVGALVAALPRRGIIVFAAVIAVASSTTTAQAVVMNKSPLVGYRALDVPTPTNDSELLSLLDDLNVTRAYSDYWIAYRVTFETNKRIIVTPYYTDRHPPYTDAVKASGKPAHIFMSSSLFLNRFLDYCNSVGAQCPTTERGGYTVIRPDRLITAEDVTVAVGEDIPEGLVDKRPAFIRG